MMRAYDEIYLGKARMTLAWMFDYGVNGCGYEIERYYQMFLTSTYVHRFERGDCAVVAGLSGVELAQRVILENIPAADLPYPVFSLDRSPEYWLGFYLSYYQWYRNLAFEQITANVPNTDILLMYHKYHEMDVMQFVCALDTMGTNVHERQMSLCRNIVRELG